jgi:hypothetical protein
VNRPTKPSGLNIRAAAASSAPHFTMNTNAARVLISKSFLVHTPDSRVQYIKKFQNKLKKKFQIPSFLAGTFRFGTPSRE